jgi:glutaredoxin
MKLVTIFSKENCPLCDEAIAVLKIIQKDIPFKIEIIDIYKDDKLLEKYQLKIPVVSFENQEIDYGVISIDTVKKALS